MGNVIRQEVVLEANPKRIYETLLDAKRFSEFTGGDDKVTCAATPNAQAEALDLLTSL